MSATPPQNSKFVEQTVTIQTHGRYLVVPPAVEGPVPVLLGLHGYGEGADTQLDRLRSIEGSECWLLVSIQGLHRFYNRRADEVVASWMTRQDRELAIADNIAYVAAVSDAVSAAWSTRSPTVFAGFSQGVAMALRAAVNARHDTIAVIIVGGDIPPEIDSRQLGRISAALVCRGATDAWYTAQKFSDDVRRLEASGVAVIALEFQGGHEWSAEVIAAASRFLREHDR
jgi:predicted esterase